MFYKRMSIYTSPDVNVMAMIKSRKVWKVISPLKSIGFFTFDLVGFHLEYHLQNYLFNMTLGLKACSNCNL